MVFICLVAFFGAVAGVNAFMIREAVSTFSGLNAENAYQSGLAFGREIAALEVQDELHWRVQARITPAANGAVQIEVAAADAEDRPLPGLEATARFVHPTNGRTDHLFDLQERAPGQYDANVGPLHGQWDLVIDLSRAGVRLFRSKNRVFLR